MKSGEEDDPSADTRSVLVLELSLLPPIRITSPDGSPQQMCLYRDLTSVTGNFVKVPLPWNLTQDVDALFPPQYMLLQRLPS